MVIIPHTLAFMEGLGAPEMMLIFVVILVLFGGQKLPEFARGLGKSMREFKKAAAGVEEEFKRAMDDDERKKSVATIAPPTPTIAAPTADSNPDGLPPEALAPEPAAVDVPAPSIDSIPPPPLIPLGASAPTAEIAGTTPEVSSDASKPSAETPPPPAAPAPPPRSRIRDDYS
jgi:sec-independent protein translocase protein TatA